LFGYSFNLLYAVIVTAIKRRWRAIHFIKFQKKMKAEKSLGRRDLVAKRIAVYDMNAAIAALVAGILLLFAVVADEVENHFICNTMLVFAGVAGTAHYLIGAAGDFYAKPRYAMLHSYWFNDLAEQETDENPEAVVKHLGHVHRCKIVSKVVMWAIPISYLFLGSEESANDWWWFFALAVLTYGAFSVLCEKLDKKHGVAWAKAYKASCLAAHGLNPVEVKTDIVANGE
jgi:hypothetical protein